MIILRRIRKAFMSSVAINLRAALKVAVMLFFNISVPFFVLGHTNLPLYRRTHEIFITFIEKNSPKPWRTSVNAASVGNPWPHRWLADG